MSDILTEIIEKRKKDIKEQGITFGFEIPEVRQRPLHPFLENLDGQKRRGVILEVKRASPSKGDIAPDLDSGATAKSYAYSGAAAISCLTEKDYFKGTLEDLMKVCRAIDEIEKNVDSASIVSFVPAVLRKDFLLSAEEIEISYRAGADAVLLIARILSKELLLEMARKVKELKMSALVEVRSDEDIEKIKYVFNMEDLKEACGQKGSFVFGVNSRDLSNFKIDLLHPVIMREKIRSAVGKDVRIIFESGVTNTACSAAVGAMGFSALLLGEGAAKNPDLRKSLVESFVSARESKNALFWKEYAEKLSSSDKKSSKVKICGLTRMEDAIKAQELGADFLGFVFADKFPRSLTRENRLEKILGGIKSLTAKKIAVIVDVTSKEAETAIALVKKGIFDAIQFHNIPYEEISAELLELPHYFAVKSLEDYEKLISLGEMRVLLDSRELTGGELIQSSVENKNLYNIKWLAGGITAENVKALLKKYQPELIDVSSGVENTEKAENIGIKDERKLEELFKNVR